MKTLIIIAVFSVLLLVSAERKDQICLKKLKLDEDAMKPLLEKVIHPVNESEDYNKFLECFWKELGYFDANDKLSWTEIQKDFEGKFGKNKKLTSVVSNCKNEYISGKTLGETAVKNQNCLMQGVIDNGLLH